MKFIDSLLKKNSNYPLYFVHIPKTAGTSFGKGIRKFFGKRRTLYDYGTAHKQTSRQIIKFCYGDGNCLNGYSKLFKQSRFDALAGHVLIMKYAPFFPIQSTVTFLREPIFRVISEYNHKVNKLGFAGSLNDFISQFQVVTNQQSIYLQGIPIELIGFVGLTEQYSLCLDMINEHLGIKIPLFNINKMKRANSVSQHEIDLLKTVCKKDILLYEKAKAILTERITLYKKQQPWVYGTTNLSEDNIVHGVAYFADNDEAVELELHIDDEKFASTKACEFSKHWGFLNLPRKGVVGYQFKLPSQLVAGKKLKVIVSKTGQSITHDSLTTKAPLYFVHIPKTAGTSFSMGIHRYLGERRTFYDYGIAEDKTSQQVKKFCYEENDSPQLFKRCDVGALAGHFPIMKYVSFFSIQSSVTILREPVKRVVSEYNHHVNIYEFEGSLCDCIKRYPSITNRQSTYLQGIPIELIGFVGLTEQYALCLDMINEHLGIKIPLLDLNIMKRANSIGQHELDLLKTLCKHDILLYNKAKAILAERINMYKKQLPWVYGTTNLSEDNIVHGVAYFADCDEAVELELHIDDEKFASTKACEFSKHWGFLNLPRKGVVGYQFKLPPQLVAGKKMKVIVSKTGQSITHDSLTTKAKEVV
jgi:Sulfotransferase family